MTREIEKLFYNESPLIFPVYYTEDGHRGPPKPLNPFFLVNP